MKVLLKIVVKSIVFKWIKPNTSSETGHNHSDDPIHTVFGVSAWVRNADLSKSMASQREPESLTETLFRDCNALAVHQFWCGEGRFRQEACQVKPL